ncbi:MAG TPA: hypothetical protein VFD58_33215 [Blastocatellia bacterium]|nr:hypothetical protein [Blastocatellia bacterium]
MLTGYNTDIACEGVTYHVQTEDKGLKTPIILSLIYNRGTILGAKRTSYQDLIADGQVDESRLAKAIERQHQIILAAIHAGKLEQLIKKLNADTGNAQPEAAEQPPAKKKSGVLATSEQPAVSSATAAPTGTMPVITGPAVDKAPASSPGSSRIYNLSDLTSDSSLSLDELLNEFVKSDRPREELGIKMLIQPRLLAGEEVTISATVLFDKQWPAVEAAVKVQVVGTTIRPQTYNTQCDRNGAFSLKLRMPEFHAGTAAMIIQAREPKGQTAEFKMLIRKR